MCVWFPREGDVLTPVLQGPETCQDKIFARKIWGIKKRKTPIVGGDKEREM